jgi:hypothetical protein
MLLLVELSLSGSMLTITGAPAARLVVPEIIGFELVARLSMLIAIVGTEAAEVVLKFWEAEAAVLPLHELTPEAAPDRTEILIAPLLLGVGVTSKV